MDGFDFVTARHGALRPGGDLLSTSSSTNDRRSSRPRSSRLLPSLADWVAVRWAILRGTVIGFLVGILPGRRRGALLARVLRRREAGRPSTPSEFGKGAIEGVAAPEAANNAAAQLVLHPAAHAGDPGQRVHRA
ncbi:MAG: tripartite tricarboxylate transporter permease [Desulfomicrobium escambiense]|nr:tripartite tricarboxylate transporter permease [Desulfomicrobium escambiense]